MKPLRRPLSLLLPPLALAAALSGNHGASAQEVHRCVTPDGRSLYTDRQCEDVAAVERKRPVVQSQGAVLHIRDCARSPDDLLFGVRTALDAQDVNKLAAFYLWTGIGSEQSVQLMDRLDRVSQRPLVDLALQGGDPLATILVDGVPVSRPTPPARLQLMQVASENSVHSVDTTFQLARSHGCWWIRF